MTAPARHLRLVDEDGCVVQDGCPECAAREHEVAGLEHTVTKLGAENRRLKLDKRAKAEGSKHWPTALAWRAYWQRVCNHPNVDWEADSNRDWFWLLLPFMKSKLYRPWIKAAIDGAAYDPATRRLKNGRIQRFDDWSLIFRAPEKFQSFVKRAPNPVEGDIPEELTSRPETA